jgi:tetratricopeptide (TPR) repeat protein
MTSGGLAEMGKVKIRGLWLLTMGIGLFIVGASPVFSDPLIIESDDQFDFARSCMDSGDYSRAVGEFERFIHFFPENPQVPKARYLIGMCYLKDHRYETARDIFSQIIRSDSITPLAGKALFLTGESYFQEGVPNEAEYYFEQVLEEYPSPDLKNAALYRLGWTKMQANRWQDASEIFSRVEEVSPFYSSARQLAEQSLRGENLPLKSPTTAGALASIAPGLGHAYVYRYKDAIVAFLLNGLFVWAAVESFQQDHEVLGGILSFLEIGWYTGNIYSAVNVAHKHNRKLQEDFRGRMEDQLDLNILAAQEGQVGLTLTFKF